MHRVVITGIGAVTPFGIGMAHCYEQLLLGRTAIHVSIIMVFDEVETSGSRIYKL